MKIGKLTPAERDEHLTRLREWFPKGSTVYTILRRVSASGMTRHISPVAVLTADRAEGGRLQHYTRHPTYSVAAVCNYSIKKDWPSDSLVVKGCGSDMGFELAYSLAHALYGDGYALKHEWL